MLTAKFVNIQEAVGKTITGVGDGIHLLVLAFSDGTYAALESRVGYDGDTSIDNKEDADPLWTYAFVEAGLVTKAAKDQAMADYWRDVVERALQKDRRQYEELKARFEPA